MSQQHLCKGLFNLFSFSLYYIYVVQSGTCHLIISSVTIKHRLKLNIKKSLESFECFSQGTQINFSAGE